MSETRAELLVRADKSPQIEERPVVLPGLPVSCIARNLTDVVHVPQAFVSTFNRFQVTDLVLVWLGSSAVLMLFVGAFFAVRHGRSRSPRYYILVDKDHNRSTSVFSPTSAKSGFEYEA
jgi:hypothetical protein